MDKQFDTTMSMSFSGLNCEPEQALMEPNLSLDRYPQFESALMNSMVSTTSGMSNDAFALRELIEKLGCAGNFPPSTSTAVAVSHYDSRDRTPLSSPHKLHLPVPDDVSRGNLGNSVALTSLSADPGFAERAAKFSCFGIRSLHGRTAPIGQNNGELRNRSSSPLMGAGKQLPRVASNTALKQAGSPQIEIRTNNGSEKKLSKLLGSGANYNEESSVSEQIPSVETKPTNEMSSRKRKGVSRGKPKEDGSNSAKDEDGNAKRSKSTENGKKENVGEKTEEEGKEGCNEKVAEPQKDYIHVRARRGQATDSHSLAERVRREKISERMKLLQDLVPGCNKVTGKALMLDEIINYVQSLQRQVEFLSMKLASMNPELDFNMDNILSKDMLQQNGIVPQQQMYHLDSSAEAGLYNNNNNNQSQQNVQQQLLHNSNISSGALNQCSVDKHVSLDDPLCRNESIQLPSIDVFSAILPEFPAFGEDDLHNIIQMGFGQNPVNFPGNDGHSYFPYQLSDMKAELQ